MEHCYPSRPTPESAHAVAAIAPPTVQQSPPAPQPHAPSHDFSHVDLFSHAPQRTPVQLQLRIGEPGDRPAPERDRAPEPPLSLAPPTPPNVQRQQPEPERQPPGYTLPLSFVTSAPPPIQRGGPAIVPVIVWFGKALAATSVDALIDFAIATILALPSPGALDQIINLVTNLVPGLGEAKKLKKATKLFEIVDKIIDIVKRFKAASIPGSANLLKNMSRESEQFKAAIKAGALDEAKAIFGRMLGYLREAQIASKMTETGGELVQLGLQKIGSKKLLTDIDVVYRKGDITFFGQVKAGSQAAISRGSNSWKKFENQAQRTVEAAKEYAAMKGVVTKPQYYVDNISDDAKALLESLDIEIILNTNILN